MNNDGKVEPHRRQRLAQTVIETLRDRIATGDLTEGDQLPTEIQLESEFGVSRTVVREAIAELRAGGLVTPVQGKGVFVARQQPGFRHTSLTPREIKSIPETLELLEFRIAVEVEAAAISAYRRSPHQEEAIRAANQQMVAEIQAGNPTVDADFAFHLAIAQATDNRYYIESISRFGARSIPRSQFPTLPDTSNVDYLMGITAEHDRIIEAIADQDPDTARNAMRDHLLNSQKRYRRLAR
ncbi:FadR/GntR family transcriptional regulator [Rhizobium herbae]|uniref:DNA-binding FadR family transcriptional regulator n=1 Tax=Rhizobium herbae TaxID=508661 RepID=A0ABS4EQN4_9HYPH|nr:FadR/GntR family transcriptional regulator [Rhizobium herbae]MBP1860258.1 DNA-binding FadR family transcriptional regulator [Rhizobium herbae]